MSQIPNASVNVTEVYSGEELEHVKNNLTSFEGFEYTLKQKKAFALLESEIKHINENYKRKVPGFECYIHEYKTDPFADVKADDREFYF